MDKQIENKQIEDKKIEKEQLVIKVSNLIGSMRTPYKEFHLEKLPCYVLMKRLLWERKEKMNDKERSYCQQLLRCYGFIPNKYISWKGMFDQGKKERIHELWRNASRKKRSKMRGK